MTGENLRICVYCASSRSCDPSYHDAARRLGALIAGRSWSIVYGGGGDGSMGALAEGALAAGGQVTGVIPHFMKELEWAHGNLSELRVVDDMRTRKHIMLTGSDAVVALPGGSGTLEELFEAITLKRLGIYLKPIVIVNMNGFFDPLLDQLARCVGERFMDAQHTTMWTAVPSVEDVIPAIAAAPAWGSDARTFARV
ncbi:MAG TPA: TIGR00730 family Rossman fold protein [Bacteroidota bacterium]|nr:TIGR00730 family Rossman fold protein [Bacteroidota bacterium]